MEVRKLDIDKWFTPSEIKYIGRGGSAEKVTTQIVLESGFLDCPTTHWRSVGKTKHRLPMKQSVKTQQRNLFKVCLITLTGGSELLSSERITNWKCFKNNYNCFTFFLYELTYKWLTFLDGKKKKKGYTLRIS